MTAKEMRMAEMSFDRSAILIVIHRLELICPKDDR